MGVQVLLRGNIVSLSLVSFKAIGHNFKFDIWGVRKGKFCVI